MNSIEIINATDAELETRIEVLESKIQDVQDELDVTPFDSQDDDGAYLTSDYNDLVIEYTELEREKDEIESELEERKG